MLYEKIEFAPNVPLKYRLISLEEYPFHMHSNALEIIFVVEGDIELSAVNTVIQMKEGDIYIASPNELHYLLGKGESKTSIVQIYLNISAYKGEFPDINSYQFANGDLEKNSQGIRILGNHIIKALTRFFNEDRKEINYYKEGAEIIKILVRHFQCYNIVKYYPEISDAFKGNEVQLSRIRHIVDYIYMNCSKPIRIEDVANMEHISTSYLTYILKIGCGMGFRMFLNMARVQKSAAMLLEDEMSMQKIAYECGFSKYEYYNATFKKVFRITPKQYKSKFITKTIANLPIRVQELTYENLKELTKKFYVRHEEIVLDLNEKHTAKDFILPNCINLPCLQYDHIYHYQFLKSVKSGLAVDTIGITLCFWNRYKNRPHVLKSILIDLWKPGYSIRVYLDERTDIEELKSFICFINGFWKHSL